MLLDPAHQERRLFRSGEDGEGAFWLDRCCPRPLCEKAHLLLLQARGYRCRPNTSLCYLRGLIPIICGSFILQNIHREQAHLLQPSIHPTPWFWSNGDDRVRWTMF